MPNGRNYILAPGPPDILPGSEAFPIVAGVAQSDNRLNTQGMPLGTFKNRRSTFVSGSLPAGETRQLAVSGSQFYITAASAPVTLRPSGGIFNSYQQGTGLQLQEVNAFSSLEVFNPLAVAVAFQIFVGFDQFLDNRLYLVNQAQPIVAFPTYPTPNSAASIAINDLAGGPFTDINGGKWYAISRVAIIICNTDTGVSYLLMKASATTSSDPAIAAVYPQTSLRLENSGNYKMATGGGNINAIVSELYQAIAA